LTRLPRTLGEASARPRPERFSLSGPSARLDPRTHAFRPDIADLTLAGRLFAPHYARAEHCGCIAEAVMVRAKPSHQAPATSQLVFGEGFALLDRAAGWAWGHCLHDGYVGYVPAEALGPPPPVTHRVTVPLALVFAGPDIKAPIIATRPIGARLAGREEEAFLCLDEGYVPLRHVAVLQANATDPVEVAARLIGAPYRWGGRGCGGVDCSGLVQRALDLCGQLAPRDSDMQRAQLGRSLGDEEPLRRGDLIFFPGHVGFMADGENLLHANAHWMRTVVEPLRDVIARLEPTHERPVLDRKRLMP
jgi:hypothetical protein